jgi:hypothetical protein
LGLDQYVVGLCAELLPTDMFDSAVVREGIDVAVDASESFRIKC